MFKQFRAKLAPVIGVVVLCLALSWTDMQRLAPAHRLNQIPPQARASISALMGENDGTYAAVVNANGFQFTNAADGLTVNLGAQGIQFAHGPQEFGLTLKQIGYSGALQQVYEVAPTLRSNRIEYSHPGFTEWYVNGPLGIEQGFTLSQPPQGGKGELTLAMTLTGNMTGRVDPDGLGVTLVGVDGEAGLHYAGLVVTDAAGKILPARFTLAQAQVVLQVDDSNAQYPVTIDPFVQQAKLTPSDGLFQQRFGDSVAIEDDVLVVGNSGATVDGSGVSGAAYVFMKPPSGWANMTQTAKLTASDGVTGDSLGSSVAIHGNTIVVGAPFAKIGSRVQAGAVYVFNKPASGWADMTQTAKLTALNVADGIMQLGKSVAVGDDVIVAGAPFATVNAPTQGAVYVYVKPPTDWADGTQTAKLTASDGAQNDSLGFKVAISYNVIVASAPLATIKIYPDEGAVYVFVQPDEGWKNNTENGKLFASDGVGYQDFGIGLGIYQDTVVVGTYHRPQQGSESTLGASYVFTRPGSGWGYRTENAKLIGSDTTVDDVFGWSVAIYSDTIVVGAYGVQGNRGAAYIYEKEDTGWRNMTETEKLTASDGAASDQFGNGVAIGSNAVAVTAPYATVGSNAEQGAAYIFASPPCPLGKLTVVSPKQKALVSQPRVNLDWNDVKCAKNYRVTVVHGSQIWNSPLLTGSKWKTHELTQDANNTLVYKWQVSTCNALNQCFTSKWFKFKLKHK